MIIYKTTNLINNKIYIGKDCKNKPSYYGSGILIKRAIKKYGKENFKKETLEVCNKDNICEREIFWISELNSQDIKIGYNICNGGESGPSLPGKLNPMYGIHRFGKSSPHYGYRLNKESKLKISLANKGKLAGDKHHAFGTQGYFFGKKTYRTIYY